MSGTTRRSVLLAAAMLVALGAGPGARAASPGAQGVLLGSGKIAGSKWSVFADPQRHAAGGAPSATGCILAVGAGSGGNVVKRRSCGRLAGPGKPDEAPLYALLHAGGSSVIGMSVSMEVAKVSLALEPGSTLSRRTKPLRARLGAFAHLKRFRYLALAVGGSACVRRVSGFDSAGVRVFSADTGECPPSPPPPPGPTTSAPEVGLENPTLAPGEAVLHGTVNPGGLATHYRFEWGLSESYGNTVPVPNGDAGAGRAATAVQAQIGGLHGQTPYYFRLAAENGKGSAEAKGSFTTPSWRPAVSAKPTSEVTARSATLNAAINAQGFGTRYRFEWGPTKTYGYSFEPPNALAGKESVNVSQEIDGLIGETVYFYRVVAESSEGAGEGKGTFVTPPSHFTRTPGTWTVKPTPNPEGTMERPVRFYAISCSSITQCMAVGEYENESGVFQSLAERLNGSMWEILPIPEETEDVTLAGISCVSPASCTAVGHYQTGSSNTTLAEHWDGSEWHIQSTPNPALGGAFTAVSCSASFECTAVGYYRSNSTETRALAERWDGSQWKMESTPSGAGSKLTRLTGVGCNAFILSGHFERECVAAGYAENVAGANVAFSVRWDGSEWVSKSVPLPEGETKASVLNGISCAPSTECEAVGYMERKNGEIVTLADFWPGIFNPSWQPQAPHNPTGSKQTKLNAVSCNDTKGMECMAVGQFENGSSVFEPFADQYFDQEGWEEIATPVPSAAKASSLNGVACVAGGECLAAGYDENSSGFDVTLAEGFD